MRYKERKRTVIRSLRIQRCDCDCDPDDCASFAFETEPFPAGGLAKRIAICWDRQSPPALSVLRQSRQAHRAPQRTKSRKTRAPILPFLTRRDLTRVHNRE